MYNNQLLFNMPRIRNTHVSWGENIGNLVLFKRKFWNWPDLILSLEITPRSWISLVRLVGDEFSHEHTGVRFLPDVLTWMMGGINSKP